MAVLNAFLKSFYFGEKQQEALKASFVDNK